MCTCVSIFSSLPLTNLTCVGVGGGGWLLGGGRGGLRDLGRLGGPGWGRAVVGGSRGGRIQRHRGQRRGEVLQQLVLLSFSREAEVGHFALLE